MRVCLESALDAKVPNLLVLLSGFYNVRLVSSQREKRPLR